MKTNVVTCRVPDHVLDSLDSLVEAGIYPTRSEAASSLIQVGLEVNTDLLHRARATAAQIRRLREETRTGAQQVARRSPSLVSRKAEEPEAV